MPESYNLNNRYPNNYPLEQEQQFKAKQMNVNAQKRRYEKALELKQNVVFLSEFRALVPSSDPAKPYFVKFRKENPLDKLDCECPSFMFGIVPEPDFLCKHIISAQERWRELHNE